MSTSRPKILRVIDSLSKGGAERGVEDMVPINIKHGYLVDILLLNNGNDSEAINKLRNQGVKVFVTFPKKSVYNPIHILKIIPLLKKYDLIHVHLSPALYWVALAKFISFSNVPLIYTEHSTDNRRRKRWLRPIEKFIYKQYSEIIAISNATKENLEKHLGKRFPIVVVDNGVFTEDFINCKPADLTSYYKEENAFIISQIARFSKPKDQLTAIRAMNLLESRVHLLLIGTGQKQYISAAMKLSDELGVKDRVHFLGVRNDIPSLVAASDVILVSSIIEGFGKAAVEGMAGSKPVVATNVPGLCDVVKDAGILFEVGDYVELSKIISKLMEDKAYYNTIKQQCFDRSKLYDIGGMVRGYENVYKLILKCK